MHAFLPRKPTMYRRTGHQRVRSCVSKFVEDLRLIILLFPTELQNNTFRGGQRQPVGRLGLMERVFTHLWWGRLLLIKTLSQQQVSPIPTGGLCKAQRQQAQDLRLWLGLRRASCCKQIQMKGWKECTNN